MKTDTAHIHRTWINKYSVTPRVKISNATNSSTEAKKVVFALHSK